MHDPSTIRVPRAAYGLTMAIATVAAAGLSWLVASWLGADSFTLRTVLIASAIGAAATALPAVLDLGREHWGVYVMGAGVGRMLLSLGYCYAAREPWPEIMARPLFVGVVAGAMFLLFVEVAVSIKILSALERRRESAAAGVDPSPRKLA